MIEKICENCGMPFLTYPSNHRKFCSKECSATKSWESRKHAKMVTLTCQNCGKQFELKACETRVKENKVHYCSAKCRDDARRTGNKIKCRNCGELFYSTRNRFCCKHCASEYKSKNCEHKIYFENGYVCKYVKGYNKKGNVKMHRAVMEEHLGRRLSPDEIVHHIDGDKTNNDISNLDVMPRGEHSSLHRKQELKEGKKLFTKENDAISRT